MSMALHITPGGNLRADGVPEFVAISEGTELVNGRLLLAILKTELPSAIPPEFAFFRRFVRDFVTRLCHVPEFTGKDLTAIFAAVRPADDSMIFTILEAPPMTGGEYLNGSLLLKFQGELEAVVQEEFNAFSGSLTEWLRALHPAWRDVGKVSFHLAENKTDATGELPFAFLATFIHRLSENDQPKHLPLGVALKAYADNRNALTALLQPIQAAGKDSQLIAQMLESRKIFQPSAWTAREACAFLRDIPALENAGIIVRIANLWKKSPPKLKVAVSLDVKKRSRVGTNALLHFSIAATLDGEKLSKEELTQLLNAGDGLVRFKGQWVEADPDKISQLLAQWHDAEDVVAETGISFVRGLRLLSGAAAIGQESLPQHDSSVCRIEAVGELAKILEELNHPEQLKLPLLPEHLQRILRPYQLDGVKYLWRMTGLGQGACLADDMGLGKTLQILSFLMLLKSAGELDNAPALLVLPASLLNNWRKETAKFTPELTFGILHPSAMTDEDNETFKADPQSFLQRFDLLATTYGMLTRLPELAKIVFPAVIADEAQAIKNPASRQSRAVRALQGQRKIAMTGTPVENRLSDLWSIFDFASPGLLGNMNTFKEFVKKLDNGEGQMNYAPLRLLTKPYILRRLKTDKSIISDLPDKTEVKVFCSLTKKQAVIYQQTVNAMKVALDEPDDFKRKGIVLTYLMQFKQICNHPAQFDGSGDYDPLHGGKFARLAELVEEIAARQEKMLIFTQFREMTEPIHEHLSRCFGRPGLILHGGTTVKQRGELVDLFQLENGPPFFVLSLKAAGTGLNLTAANHVIHFDRWWNPAVENQATDRAYRIGQHRNVLAHKFICRGTVEEKIDALIEEKQSLADTLLSDGAEKLLTDMSNAELLDFVKLDVNSVEV